MFKRDPEKKMAAKAERIALSAYRQKHPLEKNLNQAAMLTMWPKAKFGQVSGVSLAGATAEIFNANAHKGWTASRVAANSVGIASFGTIPVFAGRKNKGAAAINIQYADGSVASFKVNPDKLSAANTYVLHFNAYAAQLEREQGK